MEHKKLKKLEIKDLPPEIIEMIYSEYEILCGNTFEKLYELAYSKKDLETIQKELQELTNYMRKKGAEILQIISKERHRQS